jgi:peroxin-1
MLTCLLVIELHASFLESNLLFQVRALPNPTFAGLASTQAQQAHPLTIHLSPTCTANVIISSLTPPQSSSTPFAKVAPDGEVIVAPKIRPRLSQNDRTTSRSITSTGRRSAGARSGATQPRSHPESAGPNAIFLRGVDRTICCEFFEEHEGYGKETLALSIWVDREVLASKALRGSEYVCVSVVKPAGLEPPLDPQQQQRIKDMEASDAGKPASRIIAKLEAWDDAPDSRHAALSLALCSALDAVGIVGSLVRIAAAPQRVPASELKVLKIYPLSAGKGDSESLRFGGQSSAARKVAADNIGGLYRSKKDDDVGMLDGPLTDGLLLPQIQQTSWWEGGLVRFEPRPTDARDSRKIAVRWCLGSELRASLEVQQEIPNPFSALKSSAIAAAPLSSVEPSMIGIKDLIDQVTSQLSHCSSVLLAGGLGSGKSSLARLLDQRLRSKFFYHTSYFHCRKLMTDETRISIIKDTLTRLFMTASWGTRLGGRALIILDDLDRLCPAETELQTSDNGRSRQVSELVCSLVRQYCGADSGVVIIATAQGKEALNNVIVGGHVVREIVALKVPNKDGRRQVLQALTGQARSGNPSTNGVNGQARNDSEGSRSDEAAWMGGSPHTEAVDSSENFSVDRNLDFLDLAGQTDGYMPGDLVLLVSRAKNEALIRSVEAVSEWADDSAIMLTKEDFQNALKGFTPASLRNVTLQSSKTTFDSIGGLHETRKILLETLQYPTTYAPIFAQCPLRLRSGLLLYGYPGCGKTLLASAVAGECGLNFISVKGPEILNKYIGASEKSVRDLFDRAESARPCVLFFDEFDSIAPKRGHDSTGVTDRVVNQLLTQMDGAEGLSGVYVLAATSRPDLIDPALLRPGRLDKSLLCDMPDKDDRLDILQALGKKLSIAPYIVNGSDLHQSFLEVALRTEGYSGADLQAVIYNAHLEAIHDVLGDNGSSGNTAGKDRKDTKKFSRSSKQEIIQFRFGKDSTTDATFPPLSRAQQAAEYAAIVAKLDAIKIAKRKERHQRRGIIDHATKEGANGDGGKDSKQEVVIEWKHIEASLATTRSSVGADERRRLERIYSEFVVGRNGEMPNGQGPTEVGGRSSLM